MRELADDIEQSRFRESVDRLSAPTTGITINYSSEMIDGYVDVSVVGRDMHKSYRPLVTCSGSIVVLDKGVVPTVVKVCAKVSCNFELWSLDANNARQLISSIHLTAGNTYQIDVKSRP